jgi:hypothetical protein
VVRTPVPPKKIKIKIKINQYNYFITWIYSKDWKELFSS